MLLFHRQRDNLTEHLQIKFHHSSLILIGGIECVTIAPLQLPPVSPTICKCYLPTLSRLLAYSSMHLYLVSKQK